MDMAFGAAQDTSSALLFLIGPGRFETHQHEVPVFAQSGGQFLARAEEKPDDEAFEQAPRQRFGWVCNRAGAGGLRL